MKRVIQSRLSIVTDTVTNKPIPNINVPHETLLVIDAAQGRMTLDSAKVWNDLIGLTGLILTKLDGSARGGSVVAVSRDLALPVKLIGVGEGINDLRDVSSYPRDYDICWIFMLFLGFFVFLDPSYTYWHVSRKVKVQTITFLFDHHLVLLI